MTRTSSTLILVVATLGAAIAAAPAMASDDYRSVSSITGGGNSEQAQPQPSYSSLTAAVGADSSERSPVSSADSDPSSLNAVLAAAPDRPVQSPGSGSGYRSLNAVAGADGLVQQSPPVVEDRERDGFDWFDALIGALIASGLMLMTLAAARTVARHRRATAESRA
jgi:hypothetical protein